MGVTDFAVIDIHVAGIFIRAQGGNIYAELLTAHMEHMCTVLG